MQLLKDAKTSPAQPQLEQINYSDASNPAASNIYGNNKRTLIKQEHIPLFHKKRSLDYGTHPTDSYNNYIINLVVPDDVDAVELKLYQQVFFDLLNFEGLYIIK